MQACRPLLAKLVEVLGSSQFLVGDNLTWLDFYFVENLDMLRTLSEGSFFTEFPSLRAYHDRMLSLNKLDQAWNDDAKLMKHPFNNPYARLLNA